jgi:glyoxylase-like metal-dependent hydrolase (beta-lactamase superfamily II)
MRRRFFMTDEVIERIPFNRDMEFAYGDVAQVSPLVRRVIANNPSAFTFHGTGTYILGRGRVAIIDPGPANDAHIAALLDAVRNETVTHILITHTHRDHSPGARALQQATGAPTFGFGPHPGGAPPPGAARVEEGADRDFKPDETIDDGATLSGPGWTVDAVHTPGHIRNHLCFGLREEKTLFTGDHVMGWSTSVISPPEGHMAEYFESLAKLLPRDDDRYLPTHGPAVTNPRPFVRAFITHRRMREGQILAAIEAGAATVPDLVARLYRNTDPRLHRAAARSVLAHLIHLIEQDRLAVAGASAGDVAAATEAATYLIHKN